MSLTPLTDLIGGLAPLRLVSEAAGAAAEGGHEAVHELPNLITLITEFMADGPAKEFLHNWEGMIFAYAIAAFIIHSTRLILFDRSLRRAAP